PVAGARVTTLALRADEQPAAVELATTDKNGRFTAKLDPPPAGRPEVRQLVVTKSGFGPDWVDVAEAAGGSVTLRLTKDDVPVAGRVTDLEGKPIPKATVRIKSIAEAPSGDLGRVWADWARGPDLALRRASKML